MRILPLLAILAGLATLVFGMYLARMLGSIKTRAFGEGRRLELPELGVALRYPAWWRVEPLGEHAEHLENSLRLPDDGDPPTPAEPPSAAPRRGPSHAGGHANHPAASGRPATGVKLVTGHRRGVVTIEAVTHSANELALREIVKAKGFVLDETEITKGGARAPVLPAFVERAATAGASPPASRSAIGNASPSWVSVSSAGVEASAPDVRTYFELHLASVGDRTLLLTYTNSVLQGFLDAYYLEKVLATLEPAALPAPSSSPAASPESAGALTESAASPQTPTPSPPESASTDSPVSDVFPAP